MDLKHKLYMVGVGGLGLLASAVPVAAELNTTAIEDSFDLIYLFIPIMILFMVLGWFFGMFDKIGKKI